MKIISRCDVIRVTRILLRKNCGDDDQTPEQDVELDSRLLGGPPQQRTVLIHHRNTSSRILTYAIVLRTGFIICAITTAPYKRAIDPNADIPLEVLRGERNLGRHPAPVGSAKTWHSLHRPLHTEASTTCDLSPTLNTFLEVLEIG
jgi:hypothetical protein